MDKKTIATSALEHSIRVQKWALSVVESGEWVDPPIIGGEPAEPEQARKGIVTANSLNVRGEPNAGAVKVGLLQTGTEVEILDVAERENELWYLVEEGLWLRKEGWAAAKYHGHTFIEETT